MLMFQIGTKFQPGFSDQKMDKNKTNWQVISAKSSGISNLNSYYAIS